MYQRADILIGVTDTGEVYVAQGNPAHHILLGLPLAASSRMLYYSQLRYWNVAKVDEEEGAASYAIGTRTVLERHGLTPALNCLPARGAKLSGFPHYLGRVTS